MFKQILSWTWLRIILCGLLLTLFVGQAFAAEKPRVVYDKKTDRLSVKAENVPLKEMLTRIGLLSGVAFYMDPGAERPVTVFIKEQPLERGLKKMFQAHSISSAMIYEYKEGEDPSAEPLLIAVKVVPNAGSFDNAKLVPVVDVNNEAVIRSFAKRPPKEGKQLPAIFSYAEERWEARLKKMSPERRKKIEADMRERQERWAADEEERKEKKAAHEAKRAERKARREAEDEELRMSDPERYEQEMQHREEAKQYILEERASEQDTKDSQ